MRGPDFELNDAAVSYALRGWPVFPCEANGKRPLTKHGFLDATTEIEQIDYWWYTWPDANIGIATGTPAPDVLDVDNHHENGNGFATRDLLKKQGLLNGCFTAIRTPSGGAHFYYPGTTQPCKSLRRRHIDFRSRGGYVVAPPSTIDGRAYELHDKVPETRPEVRPLDFDAVLDFLQPKVREYRPQVTGDLSSLAGFVSYLQEGERNSGLFWAACRAAEAGIDPESLRDAALGIGLDDEEISVTLRSASRAA